MQVWPECCFFFDFDPISPAVGNSLEREVHALRLHEHLPGVFAPLGLEAGPFGWAERMDAPKLFLVVTPF